MKQILLTTWCNKTKCQGKWNHPFKNSKKRKRIWSWIELTKMLVVRWKMGWREFSLSKTFQWHHTIMKTVRHEFSALVQTIRWKRVWNCWEMLTNPPCWTKLWILRKLLLESNFEYIEETFTSGPLLRKLLLESNFEYIEETFTSGPLTFKNFVKRWCLQTSGLTNGFQFVKGKWTTTLGVAC